MKRQSIALGLLLMLVGGLIWATAGAVLHASTSAVEVSHTDSSSCPDPCDDETPCGPTCPCACCPGHATVAVFLSGRPSILAPPSNELDALLPSDLNPQDIASRVFRPPRA